MNIGRTFLSKYENIVTAVEHFVQIELNAVGNRLSMNDGTDDLDYSYNQFNQLLGVTRNNNPNLSYSYDSRGNQTAEVFEDYLPVTIGQTTTTHDLMNQLHILSIATPVADAQGTVTYSNQSTTNTAAM